MITKQNSTQTVLEEVFIQCDICKKKYEILDLESAEFIRISNQCGYASIFEDGKILKIEICQYCFKKKLGKYIRTETS